MPLSYAYLLRKVKFLCKIRHVENCLLNVCQTLLAMLNVMDYFALVAKLVLFVIKK